MQIKEEPSFTASRKEKTRIYQRTGFLEAWNIKW